MQAIRATLVHPTHLPSNATDLHEALLEHGDAFRFRRGDTLWAQDTVATRLVGVLTGGLKLTRVWPGGRAPVVSLVVRGGLAGEQAAVAGCRYADTAVAISHGKGVQIPAGRLRRLLAERPDLAELVLAHALGQQHVFARRLEELGRGSVEDRLARVLLRIGESVGLRDARGVFVPLKLSRSDLAELVGCRVETAIRVMTRWQRAGVVETRREGIILRDLDTLGQAVD